MEVFESKKPADPLNFLSLAELPFVLVPEKYKFKFYSDFQEMYGYGYKDISQKRSVFRLEGRTEVERQKSLLSKYAAGPFRDWKLWIEESLDGNIDPTFMMCIGLAETGLGRNMKTPFNV